MKTRLFACALTAILSLASTGCSALSVIDDGTQAPENTEYVTVGNHLTVHNTDSRLTLLQNMDTLSSDGLYYAAWTAGKPDSYENSDGDIVDLYDAQLYLLLKEYKTADDAQEGMQSWLEAGRSNYHVTLEDTHLCGSQTYTVISYNFTNEKNPYAHGVSAFGVYEGCALCIELTCQESYEEDLMEMLTGFLNRCSYE